MQKWEYSSLVDVASGDGALNEAGKIGWQCYAVLPIPYGMDDKIAGPFYKPKVRYYLKRPILQEIKG